MREPTAVELVAKAYVTAPGEIVGGGKWLKSPAPAVRMIAALRELQKALAEEFDGHAEPSFAIGILIARHQAAVDEERELG